MVAGRVRGPAADRDDRVAPPPDRRRARRETGPCSRRRSDASHSEAPYHFICTGGRAARRPDCPRPAPKHGDATPARRADTGASCFTAPTSSPEPAARCSEPRVHRRDRGRGSGRHPEDRRLHDARPRARRGARRHGAARRAGRAAMPVRAVPRHAVPPPAAPVPEQAAHLAPRARAPRSRRRWLLLGGARSRPARRGRGAVPRARHHRSRLARDRARRLRVQAGRSRASIAPSGAWRCASS